MRAASATSSKHIWGILRCFFIDLGLLVGGFALASYIRLGEMVTYMEYRPSLVIGALALGSMAYVVGLYSADRHISGWLSVWSRLLVVMVLVIAAMTLYSYVDFSARVGRGVMLIGVPLVFVALAMHHSLRRWFRNHALPKLAFVVHDERDIKRLRFFESLPVHRGRVLGYFADGALIAESRMKHLGPVSTAEVLCEEHGVSSLVCSEEFILDTEFSIMWRRMRYRGIDVMTLSSFCEETYHFTPLDLVTGNWLVAATGSPEAFYIRKIKRLMDLVLGVLLTVLLSPVLLCGILLVRLGSSGPIFYCQERVGRFGKNFTLYKLRSMRCDAEAEGIVWASGVDDPRQTWIGKWLRKFRIDEIPQLWNVLRGDMSLVGPRPEREEFVESLKQELPYYEERLLLQPGLTGWAQVCYPYGSSVVDARHKLEHDLYYLKHMSILLDLLVMLLDTIRVVVLGGGVRSGDNPLPPALVGGITGAFAGGRFR